MKTVHLNWYENGAVYAAFDRAEADRAAAQMAGLLVPVRRIACTVVEYPEPGTGL